MADIFISYSSHDRAKAAALCDKLRAAGMSVWIDASGISAATQWTDEIVKAIEECKVFIILLSHLALESHNVIKEIKLASEKKKHIIPVDLEQILLSLQVEYQLAGIQRVPYKETVRIVEAAQRLLEVPVVHVQIQKRKVKWKTVLTVLIGFLAVIVGAYFIFFKKSAETTLLAPDVWKPRYVESKIAILPFEFLSSNKDDEYFADGLTSEVISSLSHLQGMIVTDRKTAMEYKGKKGDSKAIASALGVRYIVDGTIQKQDKNVKISAELLDAETGKIVLTEKFEGTTDDRILLQERLARSIAFELQGSIGSGHEPDSNLMKQMTISPEAFQAIREGEKYLRMQNEEGWSKAIQYYRKATVLDPKFVYAFYLIVDAYFRKYSYSHLKSDLDTADSALSAIKRLNPAFPLIHYCNAVIAQIKGDLEGEIREQKAYIERVPEEVYGYYTIGGFYYTQGKFDLAANSFEEVIKRNITDMSSWTQLISSLNAIGDTAKRNKYVNEVLPLYDRYLEKHPSDIGKRADYAYDLQFIGRKVECHRQLDIILKSDNISAGDYYSVACAYSQLNELKSAIRMLSTSFENGFDVLRNIPSDPDFNNIRNLPEFKAMVKRMQNAEAHAR